MKLRVFVGTKRGLFVLTSNETREHWTISEPLLAGREVYFVGSDPRDDTIWATTDHKVWGPHIHFSKDGGDAWELLATAPHYQDERGLRAVWSIAPGTTPGQLFAGIEPAGLFVSPDRGRVWESVAALNEHETADSWQPAGEALALHSVHVVGQRIWCALSAGGVYRSDDAGASWRALNHGVRAEFLPQRFPVSGQCVHKLIVHPVDPERLYQQNHCGVYRSDDAGDNWLEITSNLPTDYGYALAVDPHDPDVAFVIPEDSSDMRTTAEGRLRVFATHDAGKSWQPLERGLPQQHVYVSILREGLCSDALQPCGLYFGTSGGHLFASPDRGHHWQAIASFLPRIICVHAQTT